MIRQRAQEEDQCDGNKTSDRGMVGNGVRELWGLIMQGVWSMEGSGDLLEVKWATILGMM